MPEKIYVSKKDGKSLWVDPEMHNLVKGFALDHNCSLVAATAVLLARGLMTWKGGDPSKITVPHDPLNKDRRFFPWRNKRNKPLDNA